MKDVIASPVFGVLISLIAYEIGNFIKQKLKLSIFNPLLIAIIILLIFLSKFNIKYEDYNNGGQVISFFLAPATVALALPLYKKFSLFKKNAVPILVGILCGVVSGIICVIGISKIFGLSSELTKSLIPKSITTPIGMALSNQLGGLPAITVVAIIITGIFGSIIGPFLNKILKVNDSVAMGIAMGNASHAVGTAKAMEIGETEGAMSSLTIAISGIITVIVGPIIWNLFSTFFK
ncbi:MULTISPECIES: LrgB family protein [Clostridium]|jgi:predicted murein hydrolase (TIGR00659 family)|uniref:LrgB family protein n=1 Tax=Clostridium saccharoperbutylacetonicum N1-4(HMT) TaxID=931276 RepID=M1MXX1_9CLOT|nr:MULTISPECIES: LrgB family protein [Clostridium]AGF59381.1 LrgB family protein [Clostridium saccharoperbutylacetonicum N1-4(HMT)]AQR98047.1 inner membrane protein YohK [Clostridium saccharoperbutylacetonicum]NRT59828.1 putative murein hydrolase (TIGR00659 family) [Clostridium saccharoperbutylacetonicum]NSB23140.1 putative murein hydrolase (TIGR00659 family) [Clostridium saccharoperbutylacetonicum]NSB33940.1 putative murein hydrolase (TIGR00659 family) [Clostridium saccharoperbutylacetonicum]